MDLYTKQRRANIGKWKQEEEQQVPISWTTQMLYALVGVVLFGLFGWGLVILQSLRG